MSYILEQGLSAQQRAEAKAADEAALMAVIDAHRPKRPPDAELMTMADAMAQARIDMPATPGLVVQWLNDACCASNLPMDVRKLTGGLRLTVPQLLAVLMAGPVWAATSALHELRQELQRHITPAVPDYAALMMDAERAARNAS